MVNDIIVSDALQNIKDEIQLLKMTLAELMQERDDLIYHVCPELHARYVVEIGDYQNRANYQQLMILELKRRIEIAQAALNREQTVSNEEVDEYIRNEYQEFYQKVDEEYQEYQKAQEKQAEKEERQKFYEEQWKEQYGNNDENESDVEDVKPKAKPLPNAKELYRKIVKKLHPDMNPDVTERESELFRKTVKAYEEGDVATLQSVYDEIYGMGTDTKIQEDSMETLVVLRNQILTQIANVKEEIEHIKSEFPYTEKEFLDDSEAVKAEQEKILELIHIYEEEISRLNGILKEINEKMDELNRIKRRKNYEQ